MCRDDDRRFIDLALQEAQTALTLGDYPVGAALTVNGTLKTKKFHSWQNMLGEFQAMKTAWQASEQ